MHVHVLGLQLVELRKRLGHRLEPSSEVETDGVLGRGGRNDHHRVALLAREALERRGEVTADASASVAVTHVQECELRDAGPDVRRHEPDPDETLALEGAQSKRARREIPLALGTLVRDRVLALPFAAPGRGAPVARPLLQAGAVLHVQGLDSLGSVDMADPIEIGGVESSIGDLEAHSAGAHGRAFEREGRLPPEVVEHRLQEHEDLDDGGERDLFETVGKLAELGDGGGPTRGDGGERGLVREGGLLPLL